MTRRKKETLRELPAAECDMLNRISRSASEPAGHVAHANGLLAVVAGKTYTEAAQAAGRKSGDTVSRWVSEFNRHGLSAVGRKRVDGQPASMGRLSGTASWRKSGAHLILSRMAQRLGRCSYCVGRCGERRMVCPA